MVQHLIKVDLGYWIFKIPLVDLGHEVYFYDTVDPVEKDFGKISAINVLVLKL